MSRRPTTAEFDRRVDELSHRMRTLAHELAGPEASFEDIEMFVQAIRAEVDARALREEPSTPALSAPVPPPRRTGRERR